MKQPRIIPLTGRALMIWLVGLLMFKLLFFDLIWALSTTFRGFQFPIGYTNKLMLCCLLALPMVWIRRRWYAVVLCAAVDAWLVSNLMYFRTYYTIIPSTSYLLAGNLADFQASVWESLRWSDAVFPLSTIILVIAWWRTDVRAALKTAYRQALRLTLAGIIIPACILAGYLAYYGGFKAAYEDQLYDGPTCGAAVYTIPGALLYERYAGSEEFTPEVQARIEKYLAAAATDSIPYHITPRQNCIIILAESLESWVIGATVEGNEVTPNLNRLLREDSVLYAPHMQSQVRGARSIDAQLILHTGLLPVAYGAYSHRFPHHTYMTLDKAFKERHPQGRTASMTVDKRTVWNAAIVAHDFGYDSLVDKPSFVLDVKTGPRHRLGDDSFLRQSYQKLAHADDIWRPGKGNMVQLVTYSGHTPFVIPDELKRLALSERVPERLRNYLQVANYTDRAIGAFVDSVRSNPRFDNTMIVITGDHEGIGADRPELIKNPVAAEWLSPHQFTPLIVLNSPVELRYDGVLGQVDMYPTLLQLLGLDTYPWKGLGQSILDPRKLPFAVTPQMETVGITDVPDSALRRAREAYAIGDLMICSDYFLHTQPDAKN